MSECEEELMHDAVYGCPKSIVEELSLEVAKDLSEEVERVRFRGDCAGCTLYDNGRKITITVEDLYNVQ